MIHCTHLYIHANIHTYTNTHTFIHTYIYLYISHHEFTHICAYNTERSFSHWQGEYTYVTRFFASTKLSIWLIIARHTHCCSTTYSTHSKEHGNSHGPKISSLLSSRSCFVSASGIRLAYSSYSFASCPFPSRPRLWSFSCRLAYRRIFGLNNYTNDNI